MRVVHWLFVLSVVLFVSGIGFVIAGARTIRRSVEAGPSVQASASMPVATVKQIMEGIAAPAATTVFGAVATVVSANGVEEKAPKTDEDWQAVGNSAAALVEAGNLLMMGNRAADQGDWMKMSRALMDAAIITLKTIEAKDVEGLLKSGDAINTSCDTCHEKYRRR